MFRVIQRSFMDHDEKMDFVSKELIHLSDEVERISNKLRRISSEYENESYMLARKADGLLEKAETVSRMKRSCQLIYENYSHTENVIIDYAEETGSHKNHIQKIGLQTVSWANKFFE